MGSAPFQPPIGDAGQEFVFQAEVFIADPDQQFRVVKILPVSDFFNQRGIRSAVYRDVQFNGNAHTHRNVTIFRVVTRCVTIKAAQNFVFNFAFLRRPGETAVQGRPACHGRIDAKRTIRIKYIH